MNDTPLTMYSLQNPAETMLALHQIGLETLEKTLKISAQPNERKTLRTWRINAAADMVGRTTQSIRRLENTGELPKPKTDEKKRRYYTLADINQMRNVFGTRNLRPKGSNPIVIPVTNFKGGVSKTTTALLLGQKCALNGLRVLFVDFDPQASLTLLMGYITDIHLKEDDTIATSLLDDPNDIKRVITKSFFDGIDIIPGGSDLQYVDITLPDSVNNNQDKLGSPLRRFQEALKCVKDNYDVIIIDCPPNLNALTMNAVAACNAMLVPIPPSMPDFGSFVRYSKALSDLFAKLQPKLNFFRILLSKHPKTSAAAQLAKTMKDKFGVYILSNMMIDTTEVNNTSSALMSIYEKPSIGYSETYKRATEAANKVNDEIISAFRDIWAAEAEIYEKYTSSFQNQSELTE